MDEANNKSRDLLRRYLTDEQWCSLVTKKFFHVTGSDGLEYYILPRYSSSVVQVESFKHKNSFGFTRILHRYRYICGVLPYDGRGSPPIYDQMLAQMLNLTTDAPGFLKRAVVGNHIPTNPLDHYNP